LPVQNGLLLADPVCHWTAQTKAVPGWFPNTTDQETLHWERAGIDHSKYSKLPSHPRTMTQYARRFQKGAVAPDKAQQLKKQPSYHPPSLSPSRAPAMVALHSWETHLRCQTSASDPWGPGERAPVPESRT